MKRIVIIGSGGAGKSTLARRLGEILKLEVLHLDRLYWQSNWIKPPKDEWSERVAEMLKKDSWIMDGNFGGTMEIRLAACDTAIFLDFPRITCLYRILKRRIKYRNTNRPDMSEGCNEKIDLDMLGWVWNFPITAKPKIDEKLREFESKKTIICLKSDREVEKFLLNLQKNELES